MASGLAQTIYKWSKELKKGTQTAMPISHDLLSPACSIISTACSAPPCKPCWPQERAFTAPTAMNKVTQTRLTHTEQSAAQSPT